MVIGGVSRPDIIASSCEQHFDKLRDVHVYVN